MSEKKIIVLVEDTSDLRLAFTKALKVNGYEVIDFVSADQALVDLENILAMADLILTDIETRSDKNGLDVVVAIKDQKPELPVIVMSGNLLSYGNDPRVYQAEGLLEKPFMLNELFTKVKDLLG